MGSILSDILSPAVQIGGPPFLAYLLGSIPFGLILTARFTQQDLHSKGSGNIGATNVLRVAGARLGLLTLILDVCKGSLPVLLVFYTAKGPQQGLQFQIYVALVAVASFLGHLYPVYLGLKGGGKGVATAWGCFLIISPASALTTLLVFAGTVMLTKRASVASITGAAVLPVVVWLSTHSAVYVLCAVVVMVLILCRHQENIERLVRGTEPVIKAAPKASVREKSD